MITKYTMTLSEPLPAHGAYPLYAALLERAPAEFAAHVHESTVTPVSQYVLKDRWYVSLMGEPCEEALGDVLENMDCLTLHKLGKQVSVTARQSQRIASVEELLESSLPDRVTLLSDTIFASGNSGPGGEDIMLRLDPEGDPFLPGSTLKGLLRESLENYLCWIGQAPEVIDALLGAPGRDGQESPRRVIFGDLKPEMDGSDREWFSSRSFTALEEGIVKQQSLRTASCLNSGLTFRGILLCDETDLAWICDALRGIQWAGLQRNRGFGHVKVTAQKQSELKSLPAVGSATTLHYRLRAVTPVCVSWLRRSGVGFAQERNFTESREYLPGSAVRGMVLSALAQQDDPWFQQNKDVLLRQVIFCNALPVDQGHSVIPTPMGFYDEKNGTNPYSVLLQDVQPGHKRVSLGQFCYTDAGLIHGSSPKMVFAQRSAKRRKNRCFLCGPWRPGQSWKAIFCCRILSWRHGSARRLASMSGWARTGTAVSACARWSCWMLPGRIPPRMATDRRTPSPNSCICCCCRPRP